MDLADHFGTLCIFQRKTKPKKPIKFMKRLFSKQNMENVYCKLQETDFSAVLNIDCPNLSYSKFMELYLAEFDTSFPSRENTPRSKFIRSEPWFTPDLFTSSINKEKNIIYEITKTHRRKYPKIYNNIFNKLKRKRKRKILQNMNDKSSLPDSFIMNNQTDTDKAEIAVVFNNLFSKIGLYTVIRCHNVPPYKITFLVIHVSISLTELFFLGPVTPSDVSTSIKKNSNQKQVQDSIIFIQY